MLSKHTIDCNAGAFIPDHSFEVHEHQKGDQIEFDALKIELYKNSRDIKGFRLQKKLKGRKVLNANVLDYLMANPEVIPEDWKKDKEGNPIEVCFFGTIYRRSDGELCIRYLSWGIDKWSWGVKFLIDYFDKFDAVPILMN